MVTGNEETGGGGSRPAALADRVIPSSPASILVVRLGAIGDCLRVMPALARLRLGFPDATLGWVVDSRSASLLAGHPSIDRLHVVDARALKAGPSAAVRELRRVGGELRAARYEVAIDFHTRLKSGYLTRASAAKARIGFDRSSGGEANHLFTNIHVSHQDRYVNRVERFLALLAPLGLGTEWDPDQTGLWVEPGAATRAAAWHEDAGGPPLVVFPGTSLRRAVDRWPGEHWAEALRRLGDAGLASMVLWGPADLEVASAIVDAAGPHCQLAPPTTLAEMLALVGRFRVYAGANTAALHMAWMRGVPSVVLVGGRPWRTDRPLPPAKSVMLTAGGVEPRRKLGGAAARRAVEGITVDEVVAAVRATLD